MATHGIRSEGGQKVPSQHLLPLTDCWGLKFSLEPYSWTKYGRSPWLTHKYHHVEHILQGESAIILPETQDPEAENSDQQ